MEGLLRDNGLEHLSELLSSSLTINESLDILEQQGRPKLLDRLKELGVSKVPERQKVAKALANAQRDLTGTGLPVLVAFFGAALPRDAGVKNLELLLEAAKNAGFKDQVILDHMNVAPYDKCATFGEYVAALYKSLMDAPERQSRPFVFVAHSQGTVPAYGLAQLVGPKARALCVIGRRPPTMEVIKELFGVATGPEVLELRRPFIAEALGKAYANEALEMGKDMQEASWPSYLATAVDLARVQYSSPCSLMAQNDIDAFFGISSAAATDVAVPPPKYVLSIPILAIAGNEESSGETAQKMQGWSAFTAPNAFTMVRVAATHMDMPGSRETIDAVIAALKPLAPVEIK